MTADLTISIASQPILYRGSAVYCGVDLYLAGEVVGLEWFAWVHASTTAGSADTPADAVLSIARFWLEHRDDVVTPTTSQHCYLMYAWEGLPYSDGKPVKARLTDADFRRARAGTLEPLDLRAQVIAYLREEGPAEADELQQVFGRAELLAETLTAMRADGLLELSGTRWRFCRAVRARMLGRALESQRSG